MNEHDALLQSVGKEVGAGEHSGLGVLADFLEEHGISGAYLAREGVNYPDWRASDESISNHYFLPFSPFLISSAGGEVSPGVTHNSGSGPRLSLEFVRRRSPSVDPVTSAYLVVRHFGDSHSDSRHDDTPYPRYRVPIRSKAHLARLTADLPHEAVSALMEAGEDLPDHDPVDHERLSRKAAVVNKMRRKAVAYALSRTKR